MDERTREYYRKNAETYFQNTKDAFVPVTIGRFLSLVPERGLLLDLGCGSGRDSRYFLDHGYETVSLDGCPEMVKLAEAYLGRPVILSDYGLYQPEVLFSGIWSQASLVHLRKEEMNPMLHRLSSWLTMDGVAAISLRYGDYEGYEGERYYTYWTEDTFQKVLEGTGLHLLETYVSKDVRPGFNNSWLNVLLKKEKN